jgi:hypothetical protein
MHNTRGDASMADRGRKKMFQSKEEWAVVVSLRVPRDVYDQVQRYLKMHPRMTLTEFILDGIRLRLETPADPRDMILSDDNTVIRELQEMIRAEVQAEIGKLQDFMGSAMDALKLSPTPEAAAVPVSESSYDNNTVLQERAGQTDIPSYDSTKYVLGKLCPQGHAWGTTGQSLLSIHGHTCKECKNEYKRRKRAEKRQGQPA